MKGNLFRYLYEIRTKSHFKFSSPVLHRCIPTGKNAPGDQIREMYDLVNSWSAAQQLLSDLYVTWPLILLMSVVALCKFDRLPSVRNSNKIYIFSIIHRYHCINALAYASNIMVDLHFRYNRQHCDNHNTLDDLL